MQKHPCLGSDSLRIKRCQLHDEQCNDAWFLEACLWQPGVQQSEKHWQINKRPNCTLCTQTFPKRSTDALATAKPPFAGMFCTFAGVGSFDRFLGGAHRLTAPWIEATLSFKTETTTWVQQSVFQNELRQKGWYCSLINRLLASTLHYDLHTGVNALMTRKGSCLPSLTCLSEHYIYTNLSIHTSYTYSSCMYLYIQIHIQTQLHSVAAIIVHIHIHICMYADKSTAFVICPESPGHHEAPPRHCALAAPRCRCHPRPLQKSDSLWGFLIQRPMCTSRKGLVVLL